MLLLVEKVGMVHLLFRVTIVVDMTRSWLLAT